MREWLYTPTTCTYHYSPFQLVLSCLLPAMSMRRMSIGNGLEMMRVRECDLVVYNVTATNIPLMFVFSGWLRNFLLSCIFIHAYTDAYSTYNFSFFIALAINLFILLTDDNLCILSSCCLLLFQYSRVFLIVLLKRNGYVPKASTDNERQRPHEYVYFVICRK